MKTSILKTLTLVTLSILFAGCESAQLTGPVSSTVTSFNPDSVSSPAPSDFSSETTLKSRIADIEAHYDQGQSGSFSGSGGINIAYHLLSTPGAKGGIVLLPGRSEPMRKYAEVAYDLNRQGYSVYLISHRGQGESGRMLPNTQMGYVDHYQEYVEDFTKFMSDVVLPKGHSKLFLLVHSMGGIPAAFYLEKYSTIFNAVVLSAPLFEADTGKYSENIAYTIAGGFCNRGDLTAYAIGQSDYNDNEKFTDPGQDVTSSEVRYDIKREMYKKFSEYKLGGVTYGWLCQAMKAGGLTLKMGRGNITPTIIFQDSKDTVVKPGGENTYCKNAPYCQIIRVEGAHHEILMEKDEYRNLELARTVRFFNHYAGE